MALTTTTTRLPSPATITHKKETTEIERVFFLLIFSSAD
jgi:hypothetical protein